jgi:tRNA G37 N-methylase Trm5
MEFDQDYSPRMRIQNKMSSQYNGIALINESMRLEYYDQILKECKGKRCIDVGSGSGVLAFLALKHGAKHVTCFEQNPKSAAHIQNVAKRMGLSKKIEVINTEFIASKFNSYNVKDIDILFHELVGSYIWNDMMGTAFDVPLPFKMLPSEYIIQFSIVRLTPKEYSHLINVEHNPGISNGVKLNLGLSPKFVEYYNEVIQSSDHFHHYTHIMDKPINSNHVRNALQNIYQTHQFEHIGVHRFDANNPDHYQSNRVIQFKLPETDEPYLIVVRPVLRSGDYILDFSKCYTAFTGYYNPIIVPPQSHHRALRYNIFENSMKIDKLWLK